MSDPDAATPEYDPLLVDAMLGKLARYLRICGYDTAYALDRGVEADDRLRTLAAAEGRRLVTRDRALASSTPGAVLVTDRGVEGQVRELRDAGFDLTPAERPVRCGACNGPLDPVEGDAPRPEYAPDDRALWRCRDCGQCFWKGGHWADVRERLRELDADA